MSTGTRAGLLAAAGPQSVYKHSVLDQHVIRFVAMTTSSLSPRRAVIVDGFAGRGRHDDGSAASAETLMLLAQKLKRTTQVDLFLVEKARSSYRALDQVSDEYRARDLHVETRHGECVRYLDEMLALAQGASLFLFLDPCGANLPFASLAEVLQRRGTRPRTEMLLNFSADLIRRAGGQVAAGQLDQPGVAAVDTMCGGTWWRDVVLEARRSSTDSWEKAAEDVAHEYARRLAGGRLSWVVLPVRRQPQYQPVYYLVFLTADPHGLWVFGHSAAVARERWLHALGPDEDAETGRLFDLLSVDEQIESEKRRANAVVERNIKRLVADGRQHRVVDDVESIFGEVYGEARETVCNGAIRVLVKSGEIEYVVKGDRPHKHVIRRKP